MFRIAPCVILLAIAVSVQAQDGAPRDYIAPSWGDIVYSYGPGVDPALDSPEAFDHMTKYWKGRGFRGVYLRTDLAQLDPATYHRHAFGDKANAGSAVAWKYIDDVMDRFDVDKVGNEIAEKNGFEFWAWHEHTFSDGAPVDAGGPGPSRIWPWSYVVNYTDQHREAVSTDRTQKKLQWMVREYGYPEARATKVAEFVYMAKKFGLRRFVVENRSEASQVQDAPDNADRFGFNQLVVDDMKNRYGVDILTDPRFDVDSNTFNTKDPMVENWHKLRGEYFTQFFRDLRKAMDEIDPKIQICVTLAGDRIGPPMGNWITDWRTWVDEGLINAIVSPCDFDAYPTSTKILDTYIVCAKQGRGTLSMDVFRNYIKKSKHPDIRLVSGGGCYFYPNPPAGGDAWRTTDWYDSYQVAWYQRWGQLMKDLDEFGYIKFIDQNFDAFPVDSKYFAGGYGNKGYVPSLRACPGFWMKLVPANTTFASVQSDVHYGDKGNAVKLTSDPTKSTELSGYHGTVVDRSQYYACIETGVVSGKADFDFRLYRDSDDSAIIAYLGTQKDIGVRVSETSGELGYSQGGTWANSGVKVPVRSWRQIRISVDLEKQTYSASLIADQPKQICSNVPLLAPPPRRVAADDGSDRSVEMKTVRILNHIMLQPQGKTGSVSYVDDISVRWMPKIPYDKPAGKVLFADDFERFDVGQHPLGEKPQVGGQWTLKDGKAEQGVVENQASYGEGVKCMRLHGTTDFVCQPAAAQSAAGKKLVADLDLFVRSSEFYVTIMPGSPIKTSHTVHLAIMDDDGNELAAFQNENGKWAYLQDGQLKTSDMPVALDCWNHVQLVADTSSRTWKVVIQPVGEVPTLLASGVLPASSPELRFGIKTRNSDDLYESKKGSNIALVNFSCIDNVRLTGD